MKQVINGRMYNTETATCCGEYWNGLGTNDFNYFSEDLYQKKTGEFFLHGSGGALTKYAVNCGNGWSGGSSSITPLSEDQARKWAEEHLTADAYIGIFGEVEE